jgi:hypothetical protein
MGDKRAARYTCADQALISWLHARVTIATEARANQKADAITGPIACAGRLAGSVPRAVASATQNDPRSLPLAVLILTLTSVRHTSICSPIWICETKPIYVLKRIRSFLKTMTAAVKAMAA